METATAMTVVLGVVPLVGWLLWWWNDLWFGLPAKMRCSASGTKLPPGRMGVPFFGEMPNFLWYFKRLRRPDDYINSKRHKYGETPGLYKSHLFGSPVIIACSPSLNKFVLQSDANFIREWPTAKIFGINSLICAQGKAHTRIKSFVLRAINRPDALRQMAVMLQPRVTFANIAKHFAGFEPGPVLDTLDELFKGVMHGFRAFPLNFPGTAYHHAIQCHTKVWEIFRVELEKRKNNPDGAKARNDLMDGLMELKDDEGKRLRDVEVLDNIISLVVGAYEPISLSMMWALYLLAKYPLVLQKLREENMNLSKNNDEVLITAEDVAKLTYTKKVVEETLRVANIASLVFRTATKDVEYKGYSIPKGWKVVLWLRYLHTNPENFEDPMCFNPDRWNESVKPEAFQVFGGGSRICAGNMLVRLQLAIFLHHLARAYKYTANHKTELSLPSANFEDGVELTFSKL
ncbi:hypothetical protein RJ640_018253 [Escallonia rubra]|uniref:Ent-kaurenoic acid oxidase n=1 Tax=Escallonia rubra TaxID=112253 RepID=A0AA88U2Q6_9ASTE|nr:hypothetical protein RJ640_018253 [Escallonia rubra]